MNCSSQRMMRGRYSANEPPRMRSGYPEGELSRMRSGCPERDPARMRSECTEREPARLRSGCTEREPARMRSGCTEREPVTMKDECPEKESSGTRRKRSCPERDCSCSMEIPTGSRRQLLNFIDEVSFGVYEALLFLDTHPENQEAMNFFREHNRLRNLALEKYAEMYGPLTISTADDTACSSWEWMSQPWPWEGGDC